MLDSLFRGFRTTVERRHSIRLPAESSARSSPSAAGSDKSATSGRNSSDRPVPALAGLDARDQNSRVSAFIATLDAVLAIARIAFLVAAVAVAAICVVDWAVRTRRISPFSGV